MEKIKITNVIPEHKVMLGEQEITIKPYLSTTEIVYIVDDTCQKAKELIEEKSDDSVVLCSALSNMNMLITYFVTNIDVEDLEIEDITKMGVLSLLRQYVENYDLVRDILISGLSMMFNGLILDKLSNIASLEDLESAEKNISNYMNDDKNSANLSKLVEVMLANNPAIAKAINGEMKDGNKEQPRTN